MSNRDPDQAAEATPMQQMTVEEMLQRYPKSEVEKAIFDIKFSEHRAQTIKRLHESIARGVNVDLCHQLLKEIERDKPPGPPIKALKYQYRNGPPPPVMPGLVPEEDIRNVHAVLSAYREGKLQIDLDKVTVWFAGHMVLGPRPREGVWDKIREEQKAWTKEYGKSRPWVEDFVPRRAR
ncbi:hypothetical protein PENDEC_c037G07104 [Penicillium decumbens]|uniref:Uncharacterized protein n=1 Tax=Penicillium decumbens TaxID=69771 RepID=A0A1V6NRY0_PENDC|nr:hypothetical protein PENDEC_c037G07104 [Penicillium decumbens]